MAEQPVELELEYFELVDTGNDMTLLRLAGRWAGVHPRSLERPSLVLNAGGSLRRLPALPDNGGRAGGPGTLWHAAFGAPTSLARTGSAQYSLDVGIRIDLPRPVSRQLRRPGQGGVGSPPRGGPLVALIEDRPKAPPVRLSATPASGRFAAPPSANGSAPAATPANPLFETVTRIRRRRGTVLGIGLGAVVGVAVAVAAFGSGGEERTATPPLAVSMEPQAAAGGTAARGVVTRDAVGHLRLALRDLPGGHYTVWLFDSIVDAEPIASFVGPDTSITLPVRGALRRHRFLDVSHEDDANPNHSGQSILRVAIASLP